MFLEKTLVSRYSYHDWGFQTIPNHKQFSQNHELRENIFPNLIIQPNDFLFTLSLSHSTLFIILQIETSTSCRLLEIN